MEGPFPRQSFEGFTPSRENFKIRANSAQIATPLQDARLKVVDCRDLEFGQGAGDDSPPLHERRHRIVNVPPTTIASSWVLQLNVHLREGAHIDVSPCYACETPGETVCSRWTEIRTHGYGQLKDDELRTHLSYLAITNTAKLFQN